MKRPLKATLQHMLAALQSTFFGLWKKQSARLLNQTAGQLHFRRILHVVIRSLVLMSILAVCALPAVFMNSVYGYFPLLLALSLLLLSGLSMLLLKRGLRVETDSGSVSCLRGEHVELGLRLLNDSPLVCASATAVLTTSDLFGGPDLRQELHFTAGAHSSISFGMGLSMGHLGIYQVGLQELKLRDLLGVFSCTIRAGGQYSISVLPVIREPETLNFTDAAQTEASSETGAAVAGGMDYTGVREYAPGDPMKQIHWKLSAHSRDYLTKLQEQNLQQEFSVIPDFVAPDRLTREQLMDLYDTIIETALSITEALSKQDMSVYLVYCDRSRTVVKEAAGGLDSGELLQRFAVLETESAAVIPDGSSILAEGSKLQGKSSNVILVTARITESLLQELQGIVRRGHSAALFMVVPAEYTKRELEAVRSRLNVLEDAGVNYMIVAAVTPQQE